MALVFCSDCEGRVSSEAVTCVHCGKPFVEVSGDAARVILTIPYTVYLLGSGFMISLVLLDLFIRFADRQGLPTADELTVVLLWLVSVCVGWLALKSVGQGQRMRRKGAFKDEMTAAIDRHIADRDKSAA